MIRQMVTSRGRCALIEKHSHYAASNVCAACSNTARAC